MASMSEESMLDIINAYEKGDKIPSAPLSYSSTDTISLQTASSNSSINSSNGGIGVKSFSKIFPSINSYRTQPDEQSTGPSGVMQAFRDRLQSLFVIIHTLIWTYISFLLSPFALFMAASSAFFNSMTNAYSLLLSKLHIIFLSISAWIRRLELNAKYPFIGIRNEYEELFYAEPEMDKRPISPLNINDMIDDEVDRASSHNAKIYLVGGGPG